MNVLTLCLERSWHFDLTLIFSKKRERLIREDGLEKFPEILGGTVSVAEGSFALKCCLMPVLPGSTEIRGINGNFGWNMINKVFRNY